MVSGNDGRAASSTLIGPFPAAWLVIVASGIEVWEKKRALLPEAEVRRQAPAPRWAS